MRARAAAFFSVVLLTGSACSSRVAMQPGAAEGDGTPVAAQGAAKATAATAADPSTGRAPDAAFFQQQIAERDREITRLRTEVQDAQTREGRLRHALQEATGGSDGAGAGTRGPGGNGPAAAGSGGGDPRSDVVVAALRSALSKEQERRRMVETQLARLKEETSAAYGGRQVPEAEFLAVKQELVDLQQAVADERAARDRLAEQLQELQGGAHAAALDGTEATALQARVASLQAEKDAMVASLSHSLETSQQRVAQLEQELTTARAAAADGDGATAVVYAENQHLRSQLEAERRQTEALTAKLRVAQRITDLIFKLQAEPEHAPAFEDH